MPTFTSIALDRLLELDSTATDNKGNAKKNQAPRPRAPLPIKAERRPIPLPPRRKVPSATVFPSPSLYKTPESTPVPDSPSSFPPSPYVVNHKRRGPRLLKAQKNGVDGIGAPGVVNNSELKDSRQIGGDPVKGLDRRANLDEASGAGPAVGSFCDGQGERVNGRLASPASNSVRANGFSDNLVENSNSPCDNGDVRKEDSGAADALQKSQMSMNGEFFDAYEELSSDGASTPVPSFFDGDKELREIRTNLLMEIERRKQAEEALSHMKSQWARVVGQLSLVGITFPAASATADENDELQERGLIEELHQQIFVARFVSNLIGRGCARAEIEQEMESQIESKNFEISRLRDRIQYYEAVNHEMSQRNQEALEMARRERHRRKRRRRWIWGLIGTAVSVGTAGLALSYLTSGNGHLRWMSTSDTLDSALEEGA
ncbi:unnamed protein product [Victoria cruziana]